MSALLGTISVLVALGAAIALTIQGWRAAARSDGPATIRLRTPVLVLLVAAVASLLVLEAALLGDDFSLEYVANHHAAATPLLYTVASAWGALEGSIVLWGVVLAGATWLVSRGYSRAPDRLGAGALAVMGLVATFFFALMATVADPFKVCVEAGPASCLAASPLPWAAAVAPPDGAGPNPLLQNHPLMAVHPPMLYLGYVGLTVPFAFAMSALALGQGGVEWLRRSRTSTLVAWSFLTVGITLGGLWAYEVLSWGGYWAWDPVENASLLPWLMATAFLHSAVVQERRGMLQAWNFVLVIAAFSLTILGTFLTRSGVVASVHSFTQSAIGPVLLGFLVVVLSASLGLFAARAHLVASAPRLESLASREGAFLLNNLLLSVFALVVLVGTLYPLLVEAFSGAEVGVGAPFFNRLTVPLAFGLLLTMGVGPVTPWRLARGAVVWARIRTPLRVGLAAGAVLVLTGTRNGWVVGAVMLSTFVVAVIVRHLWVTSRARAAKLGVSRRKAALDVVAGDSGYWGGQLSHIGVALAAVGLAAAANLATHAEVDLVPGDTASFAGYELTYLTPFLLNEPNRTVTGATIVVERDSEIVSELQPRINEYPGTGAGIVTPAVHSSLRGDVYLTLTRIDAGGITLEMDTTPAVWLIWLGGLVAASGGAFSTVVRRLAQRPASTEPARV
ncbi:MAG TPA: cytochrome c-type biogenesis CcmF C-terminal domain-containing protein [Acidimicrobiia bacterium]|nr:cytochrome c-type biogenesis CcmF C-terminal domain-containing protein [Acidimicrobiia bacterium]